MIVPIPLSITYHSRDGMLDEGNFLLDSFFTPSDGLIFCAVRLSHFLLGGLVLPAPSFNLRSLINSRGSIDADADAEDERCVLHVVDQL